MSKHDVMRENASYLSKESRRRDMQQYINDYEQLERDVKRYFELDNQKVFGDGMDDKEAIEYTDLHIKLSKVGHGE